MRRIQKIMTAVFLGGVLLGGIGTGIALVEYSSLSYGGECLIGEEHLVTENLDFRFEQDGRTLVVAYYGTPSVMEVEEDPSVPAGIVRYQVTYNEKRVTPSLSFSKCGEELEESEEGEQTGEEREPVYLGYLTLTPHGCGSDFRSFMENKDRILEELKQGKISSYSMAYITDVKIKVNPETVPYIESRYVIR